MNNRVIKIFYNYKTLKVLKIKLSLLEKEKVIIHKNKIKFNNKCNKYWIY